jgi:hypothetical protein
VNSCKVATMAPYFPASEKVRDALAGYLESLSKDNCPVPRGKRQGLCNLLGVYIGRLWNDAHINTSELYEVNRLMTALMMFWPGASPSPAYPVPAPSGFYSSGRQAHMAAFDQTPDLWVGTYGSDRKNLAAWMSDQLKKLECRRTPKPTIKHGGVTQDSNVVYIRSNYD